MSTASSAVRLRDDGRPGPPSDISDPLTSGRRVGRAGAGDALWLWSGSKADMSSRAGENRADAARILGNGAEGEVVEAEASFGGSTACSDEVEDWISGTVMEADSYRLKSRSTLASMSLAVMIFGSTYERRWAGCASRTIRFHMLTGILVL